MENSFPKLDVENFLGQGYEEVWVRMSEERKDVTFYLPGLIATVIRLVNLIRVSDLGDQHYS